MKKLFLLFAFLVVYQRHALSQYHDCGCSHGSGPYYNISVSFISDYDYGCAYPSAGLAYYEVVSNGQVVDSGYMQAQDAADICQLNLLFEVFSPIIGTLLADNDTYDGDGGGLGGGGGTYGDGGNSGGGGGSAFISNYDSDYDNGYDFDNDGWQCGEEVEE